MMSITMQAPPEYGVQGGHIGQPGLPSASPWWPGIGSSCDQLKTMDHSAPVRQLGIQLQQSSAMLQSQAVEGPAQLLATTMPRVTTHSGYDKGNGVEPQHQISSKTINCSAPSDCFVPQSQQEIDHSIARATYPYTEPYFGGIFATYGPQAMIHPHMLGVQQARMPLRIETEEEPVYVNAKQYHGILRRRQLRAKAESEKKVIKVRKPYLHESRHLHAMRRARGCGGRFLNTKKLDPSKVNTDNGKGSEGAPVQAGSSSGSEGFQSQDGNPRILQEVHGTTSRMSSLKVTNMEKSYTDEKGYLYPRNNGVYHSGRLQQHFHVSAFHHISSGGDKGEGGDARGLVSNGSQQRAVEIL